MKEVKERQYGTARNDRVQLELLNEEQRAIIDLRDREVTNDDALSDIEHDIDLEELRVKGDDLEKDA